jgi:hypothetical protein
MSRIYQILLIGSFLPFCWLMMMVVHELGHVVGAMATGAEIKRVVLHPLVISQTELGFDPSPRLVAWSGPIVGVLLPALAWRVAKLFRLKEFYLFQFFAGFCFVANGVYFFADTFVQAGDVATIVKGGGSRWPPILFAIVTFPLGLWLWHGLGKYFGLNEGRGEVSRKASLISLGLLIIVVGLECSFSAER